MNAELLMLMGGATAFLLTAFWVRRRQLREKYAVGWMGLASILLIVGLVPELITESASVARLSYPAAVLFVALTVMYLFSFAVSVSLSHHHRRAVRLTQELGLLEERLRRLERALRQERPRAVEHETRQSA
jgi:hypothetical protein